MPGGWLRLKQSVLRECRGRPEHEQAALRARFNEAALKGGDVSREVWSYVLMGLEGDTKEGETKDGKEEGDTKERETKDGDTKEGEKKAKYTKKIRFGVIRGGGGGGVSGPGTLWFAGVSLRGRRFRAAPDHTLRTLAPKRPPPEGKVLVENVTLSNDRYRMVGYVPDPFSDKYEARYRQAHLPGRSFRLDGAVEQQVEEERERDARARRRQRESEELAATTFFPAAAGPPAPPAPAPAPAPAPPAPAPAAPAPFPAAPPAPAPAPAPSAMDDARKLEFNEYFLGLVDAKPSGATEEELQEGARRTLDMLVRNTGGQLPAFDTTILQTQLLYGGGTLTPNEQSLLSNIQTKFNVTNQNLKKRHAKCTEHVKNYKDELEKKAAELKNKAAELKNKDKKEQVYEKLFKTLKAENSEYAAALKAKNDEYAAALKAKDDAHTTELQKQEDRYQQALENQAEALRKKALEAQKAAEAAKAKALEEQQDRFNKQLEEAKAEAEKQLEVKLQAAVEAAKAQVEKENAAALEAAGKQYENQLADLKAQAEAQALEKQKEKHQQALENQAKTLEQTLEANFEKEKAKFKRQLEQADKKLKEVADLKAQATAAEAAKKLHTETMASLQAARKPS